MRHYCNPAHRVHAPRQYSTVQASAFGVPRLLREIKTMEKEEKTHSKFNKFRKRCCERGSRLKLKLNRFFQNSGGRADGGKRGSLLFKLRLSPPEFESRSPSFSHPPLLHVIPSSIGSWLTMEAVLSQRFSGG
ncbi:hypothetical protein CEXT_654821 [Caerostris extrusa]|uniref:Uncharacterized protein n=1 Tax=Caerostris extrusa TaxID=172846 RepID=A0AAV4MVP0_CAEEX|nr:hypothetical protein CEXT_654821 [Caerostris extrusa]